ITVTSSIYTLSLHDALPICFLQAFFGTAGRFDLRQPARAAAHGELGGHGPPRLAGGPLRLRPRAGRLLCLRRPLVARKTRRPRRSEEHTSELQSRRDLVCRL